MIPKVSIVFLTKNGGDLFRQALQSVFRQEVDFLFEVIAIDSGSTDGTIRTLEDFNVRIERIPASEFNFGLTRDYGFSLGKGEILVTLSQDAVPAGTDWLSRICAPFADPEVTVVQGQEVPPPDRDLFFWDKIRLFYFTREAKKWNRIYQGLGLSFVNCAIRRSVWAENRLGRVEMSEDKIFQKRLFEKGCRMSYEAEAKVWHSHQYDLNTLKKRCKNEGLGWNLAGINYSRRDMLLDMINPLIGLVFMYGLTTLQLRTSAELLFPWVRPICLYEGNNATKDYLH